MKTHIFRKRISSNTPRWLLIGMGCLLALLLIPTLLSLGVAIGMIALGVTLILAAFSGFAVLADVLMLFGASLIALALGLVFLWITIWLIGGVMVSLVRSVIELGRKWCSKEVPAI